MARPEVLDRIKSAEREAILESGAAEREQLESRARENVDDVAEYVVSEFEEHVHA